MHQHASRQLRSLLHRPSGALLLVVAAVLTACNSGSGSSATPTPTPTLVMLTPATTSTPLPTATRNATQLALIATATFVSQVTPERADTPTIAADPTATGPIDAQACPPGSTTVFGMTIAYDGIPGITWVATSIVYGTIIEARPAQRVAPNHASDRRNPCEPSDIYTDYVVRVDATYRGGSTANGTMVVRRQGGTVGDVTLINESDPELHVGLGAVFFLQASHPLYPGVAFIAGGTQGLIHVTDGVVRSPLPPSNRTGLPLSNLATLLADTLRRSDPAAYLDAVPLDVAPPGPDLPQ